MEIAVQVDLIIALYRMVDLGGEASVLDTQILMCALRAPPLVIPYIIVSLRI